MTISQTPDKCSRASAAHRQRTAAALLFLSLRQTVNVAQIYSSSSNLKLLIEESETGNETKLSERYIRTCNNLISDSVAFDWQELKDQVDELEAPGEISNLFYTKYFDWLKLNALPDKKELYALNSEIRFGNEQTTGSPSFLAFATATGTSPTERMRIDSSGNLLVGTTSNANSDKLVVNGQVYQFQTANGSSASPVTNGGYLFGPNSATIYAGMRFVTQILSNNNTAIAFYTTSNAGSATERFRISGDGALGIGSTPSYGTAGQVLTSGGSGAAPTWTTVSGGGGGTPAGSNTQVQFNNSGAFGASANFTFNGTGISTGNVNVTSSTAPTAGMYYNSTATSGLSFYNTGVLGGSSIIQSYYGKSTIPATTNGVTNNETQWLAFGNNLTPAITVGSTASLYTMQGHSYLITDVPSVLRINAGSRGDNATYNCPADNGVIFVDVGASYGGNASNGRCGVFVNHPRQGLGDNQSTGFKAKNDGFGSGSKSFWALLQPSDPNGGGQPFGFYAQTDTSATAYDNSAPVGLVIDNATVDNYTKTNGGAQMAIWIDRRSGSTARTAIQFSRNSQGNVVGTIQTTNSATSYNTSSDYRLKENIAPLTGAIEKVLRLKPSIYTWKVDGAVGEGFIAHELQEVIPQAVSGTKDAEKLQQVEVEHAVPEVKDADGNIISYGKPPVYEEQMKPVYQGVDTSFLVATLTAAIQEQQVLINQLKTRLDAANL